SKDIVGSKVLDWEFPEGYRVADFKKELFQRFPQFADLKSLYIARNNEYALDEAVLKDNDEIALIPPVSGG
ncbi:MAG: MoaD/ThiS family protein, partial [Cyclobacteriaceae bacterium]